MLKHLTKSLWTALRSFAFGIGAGMLAAPHSGEQTRRLLRERVLGLFDRVSGYQPRQELLERAQRSAALETSNGSGEPIAQERGAATQQAPARPSSKASGSKPATRSNPRSTTRTAAGATAKNGAKSAAGGRKTKQTPRTSGDE